MNGLSLPVVEVRGTAAERGKQYGEAAKELIHTSLEHYENAVGEATGLTWSQVLERSEQWLETCRTYASDLVEEVEGIAEGAGVRMLDVLTLNARGEIMYDTSFANPTEGEEAVLDGCSSFSLTRGASGDGHVYAGQNWDWLHGSRETLMVLRIVQDPKPTVIMQVEAGQIGRQGANSAGVALNANGLGGRFDETVGVPQAFIRRRVLDSAGLLEAVRVLKQAPQHIASNALITHHDHFSIDLETTPGAHGWMYPEDGLLVHGNHYQAFMPPQLAADYRPASIDSLFRVPRLREELLACRDIMDTHEVRRRVHAAVSDHLGYPKSVCAHPDPAESPNEQVSTLLSSLVDLTTGEYMLAPGMPCQNDYELVPWNVFDGPGPDGPRAGGSRAM